MTINVLNSFCNVPYNQAVKQPNQEETYEKAINTNKSHQYRGGPGAIVGVSDHRKPGCRSERGLALAVGFQGQNGDHA